MVFKSDFKGKRTWDPDTGWEFDTAGSGREYKDYVLRHKNENPIIITTEIPSMVQLEGKTEAGFQRVHIKYVIISISGLSAKTTPAQRQLIVDALTAHGIGHNGPLGPVDVTFATRADR